MKASATLCQAALSGLILLAGCSTALPIGSDATSAQQTPVEEGTVLASTAGGTPALTLGTGDFTPEGVTLGPETGTEVGRRVTQLQSELQLLQTSVAAQNERLQEVRTASIRNAQEYFGLVAAINARLQVGTTPGNPILVSQWTESQLQLEEISNDIARLSNVAAQVAGDNATSAFLLRSVRATYGLTGAVDEDHRQLAILEDETNRTAVLIDRLLNELAEDVSRQSAYLGTERANLQTLQLAITNGELYGASLTNRALISANTFATSPVAADPRAGNRPLVVIRFDRDNVEYEQAVYQAVGAALDRKPEAAFDLVAVSPSAGSPAEVAIAQNNARDSAEEVYRTLVNLGLPPGRVTMLAEDRNDVYGQEVHLYVR
ncbi:MAG: hypothetical protein AAFW76_05130 [Pseudomonadota bacterium]